jgi:hypothetical protein
MRPSTSAKSESPSGNSDRRTAFRKPRVHATAWAERVSSHSARADGCRRSRKRRRGRSRKRRRRRRRRRWRERRAVAGAQAEAGSVCAIGYVCFQAGPSAPHNSEGPAPRKPVRAPQPTSRPKFSSSVPTWGRTHPRIRTRPRIPIRNRFRTRFRFPTRIPFRIRARLRTPHPLPPSHPLALPHSCPLPLSRFYSNTGAPGTPPAGGAVTAAGGKYVAKIAIE